VIYKKQFTRVDWPKVVEEIERRLGRRFSTNYLVNVWKGRLQSVKVRAVLVELIGEPER